MTELANNFTSNEIEVPSWISLEFLTKVLQSCENDPQLAVKSFKLLPGSAQEDNYASVMFRVIVDYRQDDNSKSKSMIIKTIPQVEGSKKELLQESQVFETEIGVYSDVIPKIEQILREVGDSTVLGARCLYHSLSPQKLIIFEDIVPLGYTVLHDRQVNIEEAKVTFMKLAKWHAISYKLNLENPSCFAQYSHSMMSLSHMVENEFFTGSAARFVEMLNNVPSLHKYKAYFEPLQAKLLANCIASFKEHRISPLKSAYYVLSHGDFHFKNVMFKSNPANGDLEDVMLLDFQLTYVGPIVNDLIYAKVLLLDAELRAKHFDELVYYYFSNFLETLVKIGFEGELPKLLELRKQLMMHRHLELFLIITFLPFWFANPEQYIEELEKMLPKMLHLGFFDD